MAVFQLTTGADNFSGVGSDIDVFSGPGGGIDTLNGGGGADEFTIDSDQTGSIVGGAGIDRIVMQSGQGQFNNALDIDLTISGVETFVAATTNVYATVAQMTGFSTITAGAGGTDFYVFLQGQGGVLNFASKFTSGMTLHVEAALADSAVRLTGTAIGDFLLGSAFNDTLEGGAGADTMYGGQGNDVYFGDTSADQINEALNGGTDTVIARKSFTLINGSHVETIRTVSNADTTAINLAGNDLSNTIYGNAGVNILYGRGGADTLVGFSGADSFAFDRALIGGNVDHIVDFSHGVDKIRLDATIFDVLAPGALSASLFKDFAAGPRDADDVILYNHVSGVLFYDPDGIGGAGARQIAVFDNLSELSATDLVIVP